MYVCVSGVIFSVGGLVVCVALQPFLPIFIVVLLAPMAIVMKRFDKIGKTAGQEVCVCVCATCSQTFTPNTLTNARASTRKHIQLCVCVCVCFVQIQSSLSDTMDSVSEALSCTK